MEMLVMVIRLMVMVLVNRRGRQWDALSQGTNGQGTINQSINQSKMQRAAETSMTTLMSRSLAHVVSSSGGRWVGWPGTGLKVMLFINIIK